MVGAPSGSTSTSGNKRQLPTSASRNNKNGMNPNVSGTSPATKTTHSRSYPRGVGLDFRKLAGLTLMSYIDHHGES